MTNSKRPAYFTIKVCTKYFISNIAEVCTTVHNTTLQKIDDAVAKTLKHVPKKKGGPLLRVRVHDFCI